MKTLAGAYHNRGRNAKHSNDGYGETIADYESAVQVDPSFPLAFNDLAWLRAACPATEHRDTAKAIQHATKACELTNWKDHSYVGTLAAVYAKVDDFGSAVKWQKKAVDLLPREERSKWQTNYGTRLKLYESGTTYDKGNMRSFSTGNMVAWWKFDRKEGLNVIDSSGNGLNGKLVGGARIVGDAERGNVLRLNGDGSHVDCGNHPLFDIVDEITIAARIKTSRFDTESPAIVCKGNYTWRLLLYERESNAEFCCTGTDVEGFVWGEIVGSANVSDGKWHHISGVYNGRELCLYVDGMLDNSVDASGLINTNVFSVMIGKNEERPGREWDGLIDDVRIYNYALNEAEVKAISDDCGQIQTEVR